MAHSDHVPGHSKHLLGLKIAELVISALVLPLAAYQVAVLSWSGDAMALFTSLFCLIALTYNLVALRPECIQSYNWIALLILEILSVIFWLVVWALHAAWLAGAFYIYSDTYYDPYDGYYSKRDLVKRITGGAANGWAGVFYTLLALAIINFILYCVSLGLMAGAVHRHRTAGRPMVYGDLVTEPKAHSEAGQQPELQA